MFLNLETTSGCTFLFFVFLGLTSPASAISGLRLLGALLCFAFLYPFVYLSLLVSNQNQSASVLRKGDALAGDGEGESNTFMKKNFSLFFNESQMLEL